ncbi:GLPGLI family protein [Polaribacter sp. PL03]|uniref:GLPGLI family protein n=1 Tax=Polaribacter sp. PL03 TaxID=3088353 RepID=UPI0029D16273|nr:GLPGLI family protein [Polaribacter sp. PL03]MDX6745450.1 GLPGLI family protein [Polaribacter sp. PL03]
MKFIINILIFCITASFFSQNISGKVIYESTINRKELNNYLTNKREKLKLKRKSVLESLDKVYLYTKAIKSKLTFSSGKGLFIVEDKLSPDIKNLGQRFLKTSAGGSNEYYYNETSKTYLIKNCETLGDCFIYTNNYLEWELTQESKKINGYVCYKATRSKGKIIVWYTPSIPINFGPKGEYGLPGLILELEIGKIIFKAKKIVLNPKEKIIVEELKGCKRVSYEEYVKEIKKAKKSVFGN